jgi:hypothetical protein
VRRFPESIKSEIITKYLEGLSTFEIHKLMKVSIGTISAVTAEADRKDNSISYNLKSTDPFPAILLFRPNVFIFFQALLNY